MTIETIEYTEYAKVTTLHVTDGGKFSIIEPYDYKQYYRLLSSVCINVPMI